MDKVLLAIALISTLSTPAMAALAKAQGGLDARQIQSIYQNQERWSKTSNRLRRGDEATMHLDMSKAEMKKGNEAGCMKHMNEAHKAMGL